jgi:ADP-ribose pyrophosphatase YjhB (NUDIX family)
MTFRFCPVCGTPLAEIAEGNDAGLDGCPDGHWVNYPNPAVTAFAWLEHDGRFLALRRAHEPCAGQWDLPGGFVEAGEWPEDALRREITEETGLEVADMRILGAWTSRYGDGGKWTVDLAYRCRLTGGELTLSDEKSDHAWLTLAEFPEPAFDGQRVSLARLRDAP